MNRTLLLAGGAGLALAGIPLLAGAYRGRLSPAPDPAAPSSADTDEASEQVGTPRAVPPTREELDRIRSTWLECILATPDRGQRFACLRERLSGVAIGPGILAELFCRDVVLDSDVEALAEVALESWHAEEALEAALQCARLCPRTEGRWPELLAVRCARDARFEARFTRALLESDLFDGTQELLPLRVAIRLARRDDPQILHVLGAGARGAQGGSEAQVALAIEGCAALLDRPARLDFLSELIQAPTFGGGELETTALARFLLEGPTVSLDPRRVTLLMQSLLRDPRSRVPAATCVLTLEDWGCLPAELGAENRAALLLLARESAAQR